MKKQIETMGTENYPVWSFWKTIGISLLIIVAGNFLLQFLVIGVHLIPDTVQNGQISLSHLNFKQSIGSMMQKSSVVAETILVSDFISVIFILYFVAIKSRPDMKDYLGFNPVKPAPFLIWQIIMVAFFYGMNYVVSQTSLEEPDFMKFMRDILKTESIGGLTLMLMALVVAAPLFEELMFRGFMYKGILRSRAGVLGAIIIPSILWSLVHVQYEWVWIVMIFFMGALFTLARYLTGSIYTVIAMHAINNFLSFVDVIKN